jgi:hypothetical protein
MKTKYTLEEIYKSMYKYNLQNETFEDGLASLIKIVNPEKDKSPVSKDAAPMIGLNPFKGNKIKKSEKSQRPNKFNELLNYRVSKYNENK